MTANAGCRLIGVFAEGRGLAHDCPVFHGDSGSPLLLLLERQVYAIGIQVLRAENAGGVVGGALSAAVLKAGSALQDVESAEGGGGPWGPGRAPAADGPAGQLPLVTIDRLLARLGYLGEGAGQDRAAAITRFEADNGLPASGAASLALLGALLRTPPSNSIGHKE
jgi:hypothetical protein